MNYFITNQKQTYACMNQIPKVFLDTPIVICNTPKVICWKIVPKKVIEILCNLEMERSENNEDKGRR